MINLSLLMAFNNLKKEFKSALENRREGVNKAAVLNRAVGMLFVENETEEKRCGLGFLRAWLNDNDNELCLFSSSLQKPEIERKMIRYLSAVMLLAHVAVLLTKTVNAHEISVSEAREIVDKINAYIVPANALWNSIKREVWDSIGGDVAGKGKAIFTSKPALIQKDQLSIILYLVFVAFVCASLNRMDSLSNSAPISYIDMSFNYLTMAIGLAPFMMMGSVMRDASKSSKNIAASHISKNIDASHISKNMGASCISEILGFFPKPNREKEAKALFDYSDSEMRTVRKNVQRIVSVLDYREAHDIQNDANTFGSVPSFTFSP